MSRSNSLLLACGVLVAVGIATSQGQSTCMDNIRSLQERLGDDFNRLMGGWRKIEDPEADDYSKTIKDILASSVKSINDKSNDLREFKLSKEAELDVYRQIVRGQKYCIEFVVDVAGCKNNLAENSCGDAKEMTCVISASLPLGATTATIDEAGPTCTTK